MKITRLVVGTLLLGFGAVTLNSCEKDEIGDYLDGSPQFSMDLFEQNILDAVGDQPVGWTYIINRDGNMARGGAFGQARTDDDGPEIDMSINKKINVASLSKWYSAIGILQLLERRGMSINANIAPWLPNGWDTDDGVESLTFRDLLRHRSGLQSQNSNFSGTLCYSCLQSVIATGVVNSKNTRNYLNANFALFRILIPSLWRGLSDAPSMPSLDDATTQQVYIDYMQQYVFTPATVSNATCVPENRNIATMYYNVNDPGNNNPGTPYGDWTNICGGGGYYLSAIDVAKTLAYYEHTEDILSDEMKEVMKDNRAGYDRRTGTFETRGDYYGKNGSIGNGNNQGVLIQTAQFPIGVEVIVMFNSQGQSWPGGLSTRDMLYNAYNNAWD